MTTEEGSMDPTRPRQPPAAPERHAQPVPPEHEAAKEHEAPREHEPEGEPEEFSPHHFREIGDEAPAGNYGGPELPPE